MIDFSNVSELFVAGKEVKELHVNGSKVWEKGGRYSYAGLTFTATQANSTVAMQAVGSAPSVSLEYTTDGTTWQDFVVGETVVALPTAGYRVGIRAKTTNSAFATSRPYSNSNRFTFTGEVDASGNILSLLNKDMDQVGSVPNYCFGAMFRQSNGLVDASGLVLPILSSYCFQYMFDSCTSLTQAPSILPATTLATQCYSCMFRGCTSLTQAPELPATTLVGYCYDSMFQGCTSLTEAPELPATTMANSCYNWMFRGCTSLTTAPELPATTLGVRCYNSMFYDCSSLNTIKIGYTGTFSEAPSNAFTNWVNNVASTGTFYYNGSDTTRGTSAIPNNWTVQSF